MSRVLDADVITALEAGTLRMAALVDLEFDTDPLYMWSGNGSLEVGDITYYGSSLLLSIDNITETSDVSSQSTTINLSGLDPAINYRLLTENWQNRTCKVQFALFDSDGDIIGTPFIMVLGRLSSAEFTAGSAGCSVKLVVESQLVKLDQGSGSLYSDDEQKLTYSSDEGFSEMADTLTDRTDLVPSSHSSQVGSDCYRNYIYGKTKVNGTLVYAYNDGTWYNYMFVLANHACTALNKLYINGTSVTWDGAGDVTTGDYANLVHVEYGLTGSATCANLVTASGGEWSSSHALSGCSWAYVKIKYSTTNFPNGLPTIGFQVQGKTVYNPVTSSAAYSTNAALIVRDYLTGAYGLNAPSENIDDDAFEDAISVCNEVITLADTSTEYRYTLSGEFTTNQTRAEVLGTMLDSCFGKLIYASGRYSFLPGDYRTPTITYTDDDLIQEYSITTKIGNGENYNSIRGSYANEDDSATSTAYNVVIGAAGTTEDGESIWYNLDLPWSTSETTARRIAKLYLERNRRLDSGEITVGPRGLLTTVGDNVCFTNWQLGYNAKKFQVTQMSIDFGADNEAFIKCKLTLGQIDENLYYWTTADEATTVTSNTVETDTVVQQGLSLSASWWTGYTYNTMRAIDTSDGFSVGTFVGESSGSPETIHGGSTAANGYIYLLGNQVNPSAVESAEGVTIGSYSHFYARKLIIDSASFQIKGGGPYSIYNPAPTSTLVSDNIIIYKNDTDDIWVESMKNSEDTQGAFGGIYLQYMMANSGTWITVPQYISWSKLLTDKYNGDVFQTYSIRPKNTRTSTTETAGTSLSITCALNSYIKFRYAICVAGDTGYNYGASSGTFLGNTGYTSTDSLNAFSGTWHITYNEEH